MELETRSALGGHTQLPHLIIALQHGTSASGYVPQGDRFLPNTKKKIQMGGTSKDEMALVKRE